MNREEFLTNLFWSMDAMYRYSYEYCPSIDVKSLRLYSSDEYGVCLAMGSKREDFLLCPICVDGTLNLDYMELNGCLLFGSYE